ncbi:Emopamil-binding protein, partial [Coemansia spiralis]
HPYYPPSLVLDGYNAPKRSTFALVSTMGGAIGVLLSVTYLAYSWKRTAKTISLADRLVAMWFVMCGAMHSLFELYYLTHYSTLCNSQEFAADMWKEYAKSDSRYLSQMPLVFALESITVFVTAPLCWAAAYGVWKSRPEIRHLSQLAASLLHIYSVVLYFGTELLSPESNCRPEPLYYYGYFIAMNIPWLLVPSYLAYNSVGEM